MAREEQKERTRMHEPPSVPAVTAEDLAEIERQATKIPRRKAREHSIYLPPSGVDPETPQLETRYVKHELVYCYTFPDGSFLQVDPAVFHAVCVAVLASKGIVLTPLSTLIREAERQWEAQCDEITKLQLALAFWKRFPAEGVRFFPGKDHAQE